MGECHINGYMNGARTELPLKTITAARSRRITTRGISHHFFSCLRNDRNSLQSCHMSDLRLPSGPRRGKDKRNAVKPATRRSNRTWNGRAAWGLNFVFFDEELC